MTTAPILSYPALKKPFILETDASILGLIAILSQAQKDVFQHPVAYASRSLTTAERNYGITEFETCYIVNNYMVVIRVMCQWFYVMLILYVSALVVC